MFFLVNRIASGFFRENRSPTIEFAREDDDVERRKRTFFGFSCSSGAFLANARADRAFLGFLKNIS